MSSQNLKVRKNHQLKKRKKERKELRKLPQNEMKTSLNSFKNY